MTGDGFPDENTMLYWTGFNGDEEDDLGERCDQRERMFFQKEHWRRPNPFHLGPKKKNGDFIGVKVVKNRYFVPYLYGGLEERIKQARTVSHDHVVQYLGCCTDHSREETLFWQQHVQGASLDTLLQKRRRGFDEEQVRTWLHLVLRGLQHVHDKGFVVGNLKASKVVIDRDGVPVLLDWACPPNLFKSIYMYKNSNVMAPEVINGEDFGPEADVWSIGLLVIELLTGQPAFPVCEETRLLFQTVPEDTSEEDAKPPTGLARDIEGNDIKSRIFVSPNALDFALWCLQKLPSKRPTLAQLLADPFLADPAIRRRALTLMKQALMQRMARTQAAVAMAHAGDEDDDEEESESEEETPQSKTFLTESSGCARHSK